MVHDDARGLKVMTTLNAADLSVVKRLSKGSTVIVEEVVETDDARVRGKIKGGWITMMDLADNNRCVIRKKLEQESSVTDFLK